MANDKFDFTQENVDKAPNEAGVYILYYGSELIYIGRAKGQSETIRTRLQSHLRGDDGPCTQKATQYWREPNSNPVTREVELQKWYRENHGRLPRCNQRVG